LPSISITWHPPDDRGNHARAAICRYPVGGRAYLTEPSGKHLQRCEQRGGLDVDHLEAAAAEALGGGDGEAQQSWWRLRAPGAAGFTGRT
jgi:hypothetical protein